MKALTDASFFRAFDRIAAVGNPGFKSNQWSFASAAWQRERHSFSGPGHSFAVEVFTVRQSIRPGWTLLVAKEHWWAPTHGDLLKSVQWARATMGRGSDILAWFREQERSADKSGTAHLSLRSAPR